MDTPLLGWIAAVAVPLLYALGVVGAGHAVLTARTSQGATAWAVALVLMPALALPAYVVFGRRHFASYREAVRLLEADQVSHRTATLGGSRHALVVDPSSAPTPEDEGELRGFAVIAGAPFTAGNAARLLVDGEATFAALFAAVDAATDYLLVQFYILRDDALGRALRDRLVAAAARGLRVYLLYDEVGSATLPRAYLRALRAGGVHVAGFGGDRGWLGRLRLNFRNHRKIVVADGEVGFTGGLNVGDEYLGRHARLAPWRDTHLRLQGPAVSGLQEAFVRDWHFCRGETLHGLRWTPSPQPENQRALILASGPDDPVEACRLLFAHAINSAVRRVWITTPYFVPDSHILGSLQAAALRGVDVRLLLPRMVDRWYFRYVGYAYLPAVVRAGARAYFYEDGFLHQKVFVVDDQYGAVGTANLDNRSLRLNFEVTCLVADRDFAEQVADMLRADFARATPLTRLDLDQTPLAVRVGAAVTRLVAPIL